MSLSPFSRPVPLSKPVLSVVGGTLVLGKPFQLLCHSSSGTLPIAYTLHSPNRLSARETVTTPAERAVFNISAIHSSASIKNFLCRANNNQRRQDETGQVVHSAIIGASHAAARTVHWGQNK